MRSRVSNDCSQLLRFGARYFAIASMTSSAVLFFRRRSSSTPAAAAFLSKTSSLRDLGVSDLFLTELYSSAMFLALLRTRVMSLM